MKGLIFSILLTLCIAFVRADGDPFEITHYGGPNDNYMEKNPSCFDHKEDPPTDYYAAVSKYDYEGSLCLDYAVVMGVTLDDNPNVGRMVRVQIVDSCRECKESHIDVSEKAFNKIGKKGAGHFKIIWVAADKNGHVSREVIYPTEQTEKFAKQKYGLSKDRFVSMFKKQALEMITKGYDTYTFDKDDVAKTTTTTRKTTTTTTRKTTTTTTRKTTTTTTRRTTTTTTRKTTTTTTRKTTTTTTRKTTTTTTRSTTTKSTTTTRTSTGYIPTTTQAPVIELPNNYEVPAVTKTSEANTAVETAPPVIGDVDIVLDESEEKSVPGTPEGEEKSVPGTPEGENEENFVPGTPEGFDPDQVDYTPEEIAKIEEQFPDDEKDNDSYTVGIFSGAVAVSSAAGIGLLVLKKKNPSKYDELKQKFPEAFGTIKRGVTRSATSIKRGVTRTATSLRRKNSKPQVSRHGSHGGYNYREMPDHMFGEDGLPRIELHDDPVVREFPNPTIKFN